MQDQGAHLAYAKPTLEEAVMLNYYKFCVLISQIWPTAVGI